MTRLVARPSFRRTALLVLLTLAGCLAASVSRPVMAAESPTTPESSPALHRVDAEILSTDVGPPDDPRNFKLALTLPEPLAAWIPTPEAGHIRVFVLPEGHPALLDPTNTVPSPAPDHEARGILPWRAGDTVYVDVRTPPTVEIPGRYAVLVEVWLDGMRLARTRPPGHVRYRPAHVDVALVIDSSRSMRRTDRDDRRLDAAKAFVDQAARDGRIASIGVVSFDTIARVEVPLVPPTERTRLHNAIERIRPDGMTNIDHAIELAASILQNGSAPRQAILLLTDGHSNPGPYRDTHQRVLEPGIPIYGIGFSDEADHALLARMAEETGGVAYRAEGNRELMAIYHRIAASLRRDEVLLSRRFPADESEGGFRVPLDDTIRHATFFIDQGTDRLHVDLTRALDDGRHAAPPPLFHSHGEGYQAFRLTHPAPGIWSVALRRAPPGRRDTPEDAACEVTADTPLYLDAFPPYREGNRIWLAATLASGADPLPGSRVRVIPEAASGLPAWELYDDGAHRDGAAGDGVFAGAIEIPTSHAGGFEVQIRAWGTTAAGHAYVRQRTVTIPPFETLPVRDDAPSHTDIPVTLSHGDGIDFGYAFPGESLAAETSLTLMALDPVPWSPGTLSLALEDGTRLVPASVEISPAAGQFLTPGRHGLQVRLLIPPDSRVGVYTGALPLRAGGREAAVPLRLEVIRPGVAFAPETLSFGTMAPGSTATRLVELTVQGPDAQALYLTMTGSAQTLLTLPESRHPVTSRSVRLTFPVHLRIPPGTPFGHHEAAIHATYGTLTASVPVDVTVGLPMPEPEHPARQPLFARSGERPSAPLDDASTTDTPTASAVLPDTDTTDASPYTKHGADDLLGVGGATVPSLHTVIDDPRPPASLDGVDDRAGGSPAATASGSPPMIEDDTSVPGAPSTLSAESPLPTAGVVVPPLPSAEAAPPPAPSRRGLDFPWLTLLLLALASAFLVILALGVRRLVASRMLRFALLSIAIHVPLLLLIGGYALVARPSATHHEDAYVLVQLVDADVDGESPDAGTGAGTESEHAEVDDSHGDAGEGSTLAHAPGSAPEMPEVVQMPALRAPSSMPTLSAEAPPRLQMDEAPRAAPSAMVRPVPTLDATASPHAPDHAPATDASASTLASGTTPLARPLPSREPEQHPRRPASTTPPAPSHAAPAPADPAPRTALAPAPVYPHADAVPHAAPDHASRLQPTTMDIDSASSRPRAGRDASADLPPPHSEPHTGSAPSLATRFPELPSHMAERPRASSTRPLDVPNPDTPHTPPPPSSEPVFAEAGEDAVDPSPHGTPRFTTTSALPDAPAPDGRLPMRPVHTTALSDPHPPRMPTLDQVPPMPPLPQESADVHTTSVSRPPVHGEAVRARAASTLAVDSPEQPPLPPSVPTHTNPSSPVGLAALDPDPDMHARHDDADSSATASTASKSATPRPSALARLDRAETSAHPMPSPRSAAPSFIPPAAVDAPLAGGVSQPERVPLPEHPRSQPTRQTATPPVNHTDTPPPSHPVRPTTVAHAPPNLSPDPEPVEVAAVPGSLLPRLHGSQDGASPSTRTAELPRPRTREIDATPPLSLSTPDEVASDTGGSAPASDTARLPSAPVHSALARTRTTVSPEESTPRPDSPSLPGSLRERAHPEDLSAMHPPPAIPGHGGTSAETSPSRLLPRPAHPGTSLDRPAHTHGLQALAPSTPPHPGAHNRVEMPRPDHNPLHRPRQRQDSESAAATARALRPVLVTGSIRLGVAAESHTPPPPLPEEWQGVRIEHRRLTLPEPSLRACQLLHIHGDGAFTFTPEEIAALRHYLASGGTLVVQGGSPSFDIAFRREIRRVLPLPLAQLPPDHPILPSGDSSPTTSIRPEGMEIAGELRLFYFQTDGLAPRETSAMTAAAASFLLDVPVLHQTESPEPEAPPAGKVWQDFRDVKHTNHGWEAEEWGNPARLTLAPNGLGGQALRIDLMPGGEATSAIRYMLPEAEPLLMNRWSGMVLEMYHAGESPVTASLVLTCLLPTQEWRMYESRPFTIQPGWNRSIKILLKDSPFRSDSTAWRAFDTTIHPEATCGRISIFFQSRDRNHETLLLDVVRFLAE